MEGTIAGVIQSVFHQKTYGDNSKTLLNEIEEVKQKLDAVSSRFDYQDDPDLVESCIYEMQSLTAKYRYLLREARRLGVTNHGLSVLHNE